MMAGSHNKQGDNNVLRERSLFGVGLSGAEGNFPMLYHKRISTWLVCKTSTLNEAMKRPKYKASHIKARKMKIYTLLLCSPTRTSDRSKPQLTFDKVHKHLRFDFFRSFFQAILPLAFFNHISHHFFSPEFPFFSVLFGIIQILITGNTKNTTLF